MTNADDAKYLSAVKGRADFRQAYRDARNELKQARHQAIDDCIKVAAGEATRCRAERAAILDKLKDGEIEPAADTALAKLDARSKMRYATQLLAMARQSDEIASRLEALKDTKEKEAG